LEEATKNLGPWQKRRKGPPGGRRFIRGGRAKRAQKVAKST